MYDQSGTENLRAQPKVLGPNGPNAVSRDGEDVGGRENLKAQATVRQGPVKSTSGGSNNIPATFFKDGVV